MNLIQIIRYLFLLLNFSFLVRRGLIQASPHFIGIDLHSNEIMIFVFFVFFFSHSFFLCNDDLFLRLLTRSRCLNIIAMEPSGVHFDRVEDGEVQI